MPALGAWCGFGAAGLPPHSVQWWPMARLVTNIQRYVSPDIEAWLGSKPFQSLADGMPSEQEVKDEE